MILYQDKISIQKEAGRRTGKKQEQRQYESRDSEYERKENLTPHFDVPIHIDFKKKKSLNSMMIRNAFPHLTKKHYIRTIRSLHADRHAYL